MAVLERAILCTVLLLWCLVGCHDARAMQKHLSPATHDKHLSPATDDKHSPLLHGATHQHAFNNPQTKEEAKSADVVVSRGFSQTRDASEMMFDGTQSRDTGQAVLRAIQQAERHLAMEVKHIFDLDEAIESATHGTEKNKIGTHVLDNKNQPLPFIELKGVQPNSLNSADCVFDGSTTVCKDGNTSSKTDLTRKQLATLSHAVQTSNISSNPLSHGSDVNDDFIRNGHHKTTAMADTINSNKNEAIDKRFFGRRVQAVDTCNLDSARLALSFSEYIETEAGSLQLTCSGLVQVNKCEGQCSSRVTPSVNHVDGFEKVCSCCRDSATTTRAVTLNSCVLGTQEVVGYSLSRDVVEPTTCACRACRN